ncbi:MAG: sigma-70 family RNA polymerase sigma factor [Bacteroidota bacterium]
MIVSGKRITYHSKEFKELFDQLFPSMCVVASMVLKDDAKGKDVAQEAMIKLWQKPDENFASVNSLKAYLYVLVRNACISQLRKEKDLHFDSIENHYELVNEKDLLHEVLREETYNLLHKAIDELSPQARKVMQLTINGLTNSEISDRIEVSINTVKTVKKRAYKTVREKLGSHFFYN